MFLRPFDLKKVAFPDFQKKKNLYNWTLRQAVDIPERSELA